MTFWIAIVLIIGMYVLLDLYKLKQQCEIKKEKAQNENGDVINRLEELEYRLANLESLFLEREKENRFHQALYSEKEER